MVFHGPLPEFEAKRVMDAFQSLGTPSVSRADYVSTLEHVRRTAPGASEDVPLDTTHTAHYNSYDMMKAARLRQRRPSQAPQEMFAKPLTQLQEIGWRSDETPVGYERHPKKACEETKFMGVLWKNGYM